MKIEINVSDFYLDNEDNLEQGLKDYIKRETIQAISSQIKQKVETQITMEVKDKVEQMLYREISSAILENIESGKTKSRRNSNEFVTFKEYVKECFEYNTGYQSFENTIKKLAETFSSEMKQRYDLMFASQIVIKMGDAGLLKSDELAKLLEPKK